MDVITSNAPYPPETQLLAALKALETVQDYAGKTASTSLNSRNNYVKKESKAAEQTPGQLLASFLKEQLLSREKARQSAEEHAQVAARALIDRESQLHAMKMKYETLKGSAESRGIATKNDEENIDDAQSTADTNDTDDTLCEAKAAVHLKVNNHTLVVDKAKAKDKDKDKGKGKTTGKAESTKQIIVATQSNKKEEQLLRSEIAMLERKCERADDMAQRAKNTVKVLQHKLRQEQETVATLRQDKQHLQEQLIAAVEKPAMDESDRNVCLLEQVKECHTTIEALKQQCAQLSGKLEEAQSRRDIVERTLEEKNEIARSTTEALQHQVQELSKRLYDAETTAQECVNVRTELDEAWKRSQELETELELERSLRLSTAAELARMVDVATTNADELMEAREKAVSDAQMSTALEHEAAGLRGRVEALQHALDKIQSESGGAFETLETFVVETQAQLQSRVRQLEMECSQEHSARQACEAQLAEQVELCKAQEHTLEVLRQDLASTTQRLALLQESTTAVTNQLGPLTTSNEALQNQLEEALQSVASLTDQLDQEKQRALEAEAECRDVKSLLDTAISRQDILSSELAEASTQLSSVRTKLEMVERQRNEAIVKTERIETKYAAVLKECDALRKAGAVSRGEAQTLVDNMCDMTGMMDALDALRQRNTVLEDEIELALVKLAHLSSENEGLSADLKVVNKEAELERKRADEYAASSAQLSAERAAIASQLATLETEHNRLEDHCNNLETRLAHWEEVAVAGEERDRRLASAESKLAVAERRETKWAEAAVQIRQLQAELACHLEDVEELRHAKDEAEERCALLTTRCTELFEEAHQAKDMVEELDKRVILLTKEKEEVLMELEEVMAELEKAHAGEAKAEVLERALAKGSEDARHAVTVLTEELATRCNEAVAAAQEKERLEAALQAADAARSALQEVSDRQQDELKMVMNEKNALTDKLATAKSQAAAAEKRIAELVEESAQQGEEMRNLARRCEVAEVLREEGVKQLDVARAACKDAEAKLMDVRGLILAVSELESIVVRSSSWENNEEVPENVVNNDDDRGGVDHDRTLLDVSSADSSLIHCLVARVRAMMAAVIQMQKSLDTAQHNAQELHAREELWEGEKTVLRAICKVALAVTIDRMDADKKHPNKERVGAPSKSLDAESKQRLQSDDVQNAQAVLAELQPIIAANETALRSLGLSAAWSSLSKLAKRDKALALATTSKIATMAKTIDDLEVKCRAAQNCASIQRRRADEAEAALIAEGERVRELVTSVCWAAGDVDAWDMGAEDKEDKEPATSSMALVSSISALERVVGRLLRRYRALTRTVSRMQAKKPQKSEMPGPSHLPSKSDLEDEDVIPAYVPIQSPMQKSYRG